MYRVEFFTEENSIYELDRIRTYSISDGLDKINISAEQITGTDYFANEPRRIEFVLFNDNWIEKYMLSGKYEYEKFISQYRVRFYKNEDLFFTGIIDTSNLSYDIRSEEVSFIVYDYLKIMKIYDDIIFVLNNVSLIPHEYLSRCVNSLNTRWRRGSKVFRFKLTFDPDKQIYNHLRLDTNNRLLLHVIESEPENKLRTNFINYSGFKEIDGRYYFLIFQSTTQIGKLSGKWVCQKMEYSCVTYEITNRIQISKIHEIVKTNTYKYPPGNDSMHDFFNNIQKEPFKIYFDGFIKITGSHTKSVGDRRFLIQFSDNELTNIKNFDNGTQNPFSVPDLNFQWMFNIREIPVYNNKDIIVRFDHEYEVYFQGDFLSEQFIMAKALAKYIDILKVLLLLHNLTIRCDAKGEFIIQNKENSNNINMIKIDLNDVFEMDLKRANKGKIDLNLIEDAIEGDTTVLQNILLNYYNDFLSSKWEISLVIPEKYNVKLFDNIEIDSKIYQVASIKPNISNQCIEIRAWKQERKPTALMSSPIPEPEPEPGPKIPIIDISGNLAFGYMIEPEPENPEIDISGNLAFGFMIEPEPENPEIDISGNLAFGFMLEPRPKNPEIDISGNLAFGFVISKDV